MSAAPRPPRSYVELAPGPHGIMFHHLHGGGHLPRQGSITAAGLETLLDFVGASVELLSAGEWLARAAAGRLRPRDVCLTFDDGLRCQLDLALPVLERRGLGAFFFVYSSALRGERDRLELYAHYRHSAFPSIEDFYRAFFATVAEAPGGARRLAALAELDPARYLADCPFYTDDDRRFRYLRDRLLEPAEYFALMDAMIGEDMAELEATARKLWLSEEDVRRLRRRGHVVGLHSYSHPTRLRALDAAAQRREYARNKTHLEDLLGEPVTAVAHPCGSYDPRTLEILRRLGVTVGFRADMASPSADPLELPRQDHANVVRMLGGGAAERS